MQSATAMQNQADYKSPSVFPLIGTSLLRAVPEASERDLQRAFSQGHKLVAVLAPAPAPALEQAETLDYEPEHTNAFTPARM